MELLGVETVPLRKMEKAPEDLLQKALSLEELKKNGYTAFSLGVVYVYAMMDQSLPERFAAENIGGRKQAVRGGTVCFDRAVLARCKEWDHCLDVMDNESYEKFKSWMLIQMYVNKEKKNVLTPRLYSAQVLDPFALRADKPVAAVLDTYSISGMYSTLRPVMVAKREMAPSFIDFERSPAEEGALQQGRQLLATMGVTL